MKLNIDEWKEFKVGILFEIEATKGVNSEELILGSDIPYIAAKKSENGLMKMVEKENHEDWISRGNCIVFIQLGAGSAGYTNYIPTDFIGMNGKTSCGYIDRHMNSFVGMFIVTLLDKERPKYSYGRSWSGDRLRNTIVKLPICYTTDEDGNKTPEIDEAKQYSEEGYIPDFKFMEDYIKSLNYKPLTTKNKKGKALKLNVDKWKEFLLTDIFNVEYGNNLNKNAMTSQDAKINFISRKGDNNGVDIKVDLIESETLFSKGSITIALGGSLGSTFIQTKSFYTGQNIAVLTSPDELSVESKLFIIKLIEFESKYKYFPFGRELNRYIQTVFSIKLPIKYTIDEDGNEIPKIDETKQYSKEGYIPDFEFMENYIKSLPYGDRL